MFSGLIQEVGRVDALERRGNETILSVGCALVREGAVPGDSIAVNGVCLTVESFDEHFFTAYVGRETLRLTTLGNLRRGEGVNLEAAVRATDRLGGHVVQGHVEGVGSVREVKTTGREAAILARIPEELLPAIVSKASIALDGISLTVAELDGSIVRVAVIPGTLERTTMKGWRPGRPLNVETDIIGRYVAAYLGRLQGKGNGLSLEALRKKGF